MTRCTLLPTHDRACSNDCPFPSFLRRGGTLTFPEKKGLRDVAHRTSTFPNCVDHFRGVLHQNPPSTCPMKLIPVIRGDMAFPKKSGLCCHVTDERETKMPHMAQRGLDHPFVQLLVTPKPFVCLHREGRLTFLLLQSGHTEAARHHPVQWTHHPRAKGIECT